MTPCKRCGRILQEPGALRPYCPSAYCVVCQEIIRKQNAIMEEEYNKIMNDNTDPETPKPQHPNMDDKEIIRILSNIIIDMYSSLRELIPTIKAIKDEAKKKTKS